jgi:Flp pilus assembly pilin Flp
VTTRLKFSTQKYRSSPDNYGAAPDAASKEWTPVNLFVLKTWLEAKLNKDEEGASLVEYILLVALIALAVIAAVIFLRNQVSDKFNDAGSKLSTNG